MTQHDGASRSRVVGVLWPEETSGGRWVFEGVGALTPRLYLTGAGGSSQSPGEVRRRLEAHLATGAPAFDPYGAAVG